MLHSPRGTFPETYKKLWIAFLGQNEIGLEYLSGYWNGTMVTERFGNQVVARQDGDGLCSIDDLDPDLVSPVASDSYYYHDMIYYLISLGYKPGVTLFGFPYDWRQSVRHPATLQKLRDLIHRLHESSDSIAGTGVKGQRQPVDIMTHSMGGLLMKSYVSRYMEDASGILGQWTAIGTPWRGGGSIAYKAMISGYALDMTTIPIVDWGLREDVAHAIELNWPSAFELMPDVDNDPWWKQENLASPPTIDYQITGQVPHSASTAQDIKDLLVEVNKNNKQIWIKGQPATPNPLNIGALEQAQGTRKVFFETTARLANLRKSLGTDFNTFLRNDGGKGKIKPVSLRITSIGGSNLQTKYSLSFKSPVATAEALQKLTPAYSYVGGDGTVPYASALSDGLGAEHFVYRGLADHQRLLRTPEIMNAARQTYAMACLLEGTWIVDILGPDGKIFSQQYWTFESENGVVPPSKLLTAIAPTAFETTRPDGTKITGTLSSNCMSFTGFWHTTYRTQAQRVLGKDDCTSPYQTKRTDAPNGYFLQSCIYGNWSRASTLYCDAGYKLNEPLNTACVPIHVPAPEDGPPRGPNNTTRNIIIIVFSAIGVIVLTAAVIFVVRKLSAKKGQNPYRRIALDDPSNNLLQ